MYFDNCCDKKLGAGRDGALSVQFPYWLFHLT